MVFGRVKGFKVSDETKAKRVAWLAGPEGLAYRARMAERMKAKWAEQKGGMLE